MNRKTILIILVLGLGLVVGIPVGVLAHRKSSQQKQCVKNMMNLWECGRSTSLANSIPFDELLDVSLVTNYYPRPAATPCPSTDEFYHSFKMLDGPVCPFGHIFPEHARAMWQFDMKEIHENNRRLKANKFLHGTSLERRP